MMMMLLTPPTKPNREAECQNKDELTHSIFALCVAYGLRLHLAHLCGEGDQCSLKVKYDLFIFLSAEELETLHAATRPRTPHHR